jgi:hypothetical protein
MEECDKVMSVVREVTLREILNVLILGIIVWEELI